MIRQVGDRNQLFLLPVSSFVDGHSEAVAGLPSLFNIRVLLNGSYDRLAAYSLPGKFDVPPKKFPTVRSRLAMAKSKISSLIARSHFASSGNVCTGDEVIAARRRYTASCLGVTSCRCGLGRISRESKRKGRSISHILALCKLKCIHSSLLRGGNIPEQGFPHCRIRFVKASVSRRTAFRAKSAARRDIFFASSNWPEYADTNPSELAIQSSTPGFSRD